jgi:molecular chaperone GrpE (heat shock protein)
MGWFSKQGGAVAGKEPTEEAEVGSTTGPDIRVTGEVPARSDDNVPTSTLDAPPADPPDTGPDPFTQAVGSLASRQDELNRLFEDRLRSDQVQADVLQHLHDEMRAYRDNFIRKAQQGVLKEVMHCYDFVSGERDTGAEGGIGSLDHLKDMLIDLLFKYDIEPFRSESDEFDRDSQQCLRTVPTPEPEKDRKVAARGLVGFRDRDGILRKEQVTVFKFNQPTGG